MEAAQDAEHSIIAGVADMDITHAPGGVQDDDRRHMGDAVAPADAPPNVQQHGEWRRRAALPHKLRQARAVHADCYHRKAQRVPLRGQRPQGWHLRLPGITPECPEVQHHRPPAPLRQGADRTAHIRQGEGGSGCAGGQECLGRGRAAEQEQKERQDSPRSPTPSAAGEGRLTANEGGFHWMSSILAVARPALPRTSGK